MKYTENQIDTLRQTVGSRLSEKRFAHTLSVEKMALKIGEKCLPHCLSELSVAALLHDISKEYSEAEHFSLINKYKVSLTEQEICEPALWHSITAPLVIREEFSEYAEEDILSAVYNHTVGSPDMSVFDEIILLADYIEEGRKYERCVSLREEFLSELDASTDFDTAILALHSAVAKSLNNNIEEFISRGKAYHSRTELTRDALYAKIERHTMENNKDMNYSDSTTLAREAVKVLIEKKGIDVALFDVREKSSVTDYYVNVTGRSTSNVASLADDVDEKLSELGRAPLRTEGRRGGSWILVDFGDVIVNVFDKASREFYNLDRHLPEGSRVDISDLVAEVDAKFDIKQN